MSVRNLFLASVSAAFLAAFAAVSGSAAATTPNANAVLAAKAYKALAAGDPAAAVEAYTKAIESRELQPEVLANALLNRGLAYQHLNQNEDAVDDYTAAMRVDAMSAKLRAMALYNRGLSYQKLQQPSLAMEDFTSALFLDAGFAHAYYSRANMLRTSGQHLFALADYEKALQSGHPDKARVHYGEALTFDALNRPEEARAALTRAVAANPGFQPAVKRLAALDGVSSDGADPITTASIATKTLPPAAAPAAELLGTAETQVEPASTTKKYTDRVPVEAEPPVEEKIVAIEPVVEPAAPEAVAEEPAETAETEVAAIAEQPEEPVAAEPKLSGWSVQLASATSEDAAWSVWKKMQSRYKVLADKNPVVVKADLGTKGTFYRVRLTGYDHQDDAKSACSKLKAKGVKCFISKAGS